MKGVKKVFSNDVMQFIFFINDLSKGDYENIIVTIQVIFIILEMVIFFYIKYKLFEN